MTNPPKKNGLIYTTVSFGGPQAEKIGDKVSGMDFQPFLPEIREALRIKQEGMITTVHQVPRLVYSVSFKPYFVEKNPTGPALQDMIRANENFNIIRNKTDKVTPRRPTAEAAAQRHF